MQSKGKAFECPWHIVPVLRQFVAVDCAVCFPVPLYGRCGKDRSLSAILHCFGGSTVSVAQWDESSG